MLVMLVGDNAMEVAGDGAHVAVDGPLVVVQNDNHPFGLLGDVVQRLERYAVGKRSVAGDGNHVLLAARHISRHSNSQSRGKRGAGVPAP